MTGTVASFGVELSAMARCSGIRRKVGGEAGAGVGVGVKAWMESARYPLKIVTELPCRVANSRECARSLDVLDEEGPCEDGASMWHGGP